MTLEKKLAELIATVESVILNLESASRNGRPEHLRYYIDTGVNLLKAALLDAERS